VGGPGADGGQQGEYVDADFEDVDGDAEADPDEENVESDD
jgi:hypothetical protein